MSSDPFSDILKLTNAEAVTTGGFTAGGKWSIRFPGRDKIKFFAIAKGECMVRLEEAAKAVKFETGDVALLARRQSFTLFNDADIEPLEAVSLFSARGRTTAQLGDGQDFTHIGGHILLDPQRGHLLADILPSWIHIRAASPYAKTFRLLLDQLIEERAAALPGTQLASSQLTQLLFIQVIRAHLANSDLLPAGWLRAISDLRIAPAIRAMHETPDHPWHLRELAQACAMSRTAFALYFKNIAGISPLSYLTAWRMHLAERQLREETTSITVIAQSLGYGSESAFSNAFKRVIGISPNTYRKQSAPHLP
ncbi:AraC family transcriptional regulator [Thalassospira marina]|uniref:AraC family transcriptional regulator n=1 Tax=Thalassospira marina TaxID=2048283 RepID=A0ABM6QFA9_9PROT|nr:AraC family transcriptional regulator [Thalassospira marina]AUG55222.1 AraC family transcriptional regulator [Thalassospira marina]